MLSNNRTNNQKRIEKAQKRALQVIFSPGLFEPYNMVLEIIRSSSNTISEANQDFISGCLGNFDTYKNFLQGEWESRDSKTELDMLLFLKDKVKDGKGKIHKDENVTYERARNELSKTFAALLSHENSRYAENVALEYLNAKIENGEVNDSVFEGAVNEIKSQAIELFNSDGFVSFEENFDDSVLEGIFKSVVSELEPEVEVQSVPVPEDKEELSTIDSESDNMSEDESLVNDLWSSNKSDVKSIITEDLDSVQSTTDDKLNNTQLNKHNKGEKMNTELSQKMGSLTLRDSETSVMRSIDTQNKISGKSVELVNEGKVLFGELVEARNRTFVNAVTMVTKQAEDNSKNTFVAVATGYKAIKQEHERVMPKLNSFNTWAEQELASRVEDNQETKDLLAEFDLM